MIGVMAPAPGHSAGVALLSIDGTPPKAFRVGDAVDTGVILQSLSQRTVRFGPQDGSDLLSVDLPGLPPAETGSLPPPSGITQDSGQDMSASSGQSAEEFTDARPAD